MPVHWTCHQIDDRFEPQREFNSFILIIGIFCNSIFFSDGMTDCSDSECCSHPVCSEHIMCLASNDPVEVLLRKQPPSVTASFYQRVKFLIEENSVQSYAHMDEYSERWVISYFHVKFQSNQIIVLLPLI